MLQVEIEFQSTKNSIKDLRRLVEKRSSGEKIFRRNNSFFI